MKDFDYLFNFNSEAKFRLKSWWDEPKTNSGIPSKKGKKAELRRCHTPEEVSLLGFYHDLRISLAEIGFDDPDRVAMVAGLCAHVRSDDVPISLAKQMASSKGEGDRPQVSELRFRRFLAIDNQTELYQTLIRIIRMLGGGVNLYSLASVAANWNEKTKKELSSDYYEHVKITKKEKKL